MFDQARQFTLDHAEPAAPAERPTLTLVQQADASPPAQPEARRFELPRSVWAGMLASYGVFFAAITIATGGSGQSVFAIVISLLYTAMYFGLARVIARQAGPDAKSPLLRGEALPTWCGPMDAKAVYGQILVVPMAVALFGVGIAVICAVVL
ncbi:hypothetical protein [Alteraurantiacibacter buctensis]|uniref:Uncharacterized protein n=1 Tax=Alteraurantiacibacter buctensis TaxID=1503981 RepID=A0A844Z117_9SPHN|nr:hypothetical protein [Alteraurantiacibacter buctensis]MXO71593.1 hypothetical protein [Alteraurantiacibacter buctensis]